MRFLFRKRVGSTYTEKIVNTPNCPTCQEQNWIKKDEQRIKCKTCEEVMKIK